MFEAPSTIAIRRLLITLLFGAVAGMLTLHAVSPARSARLEMLERQHLRLKGLVARIEEDNDRLEAELSALEEGLEGWRDVARREYRMVLPGEVVFRFPVNAR